MMERFITILLCYFSFACFQAKASIDSNRLVQYNIENGFPSNNVYSVIKDRNGYLWFATDNGVVKYNGYTLRIFNTNDGLPSNDVWQLYEDNRGRIWLQSFSYQFGYIKDDKYYKIDFKMKDKMLKPEKVSQIGNYVYFVFATGARGRNIGMVDTNGHAEIIEATDEYYTTLLTDTLLYTFSLDGVIRSFSLNGRKKIPRSKNSFDLVKTYVMANNHEVWHDTIYLYMFKDDKILLGDIKNEKTFFRNLKEYGADNKERIYNAVFKPGMFYVLSSNHVFYVNHDLTLKEKVRVEDILPEKSQISYVLKQQENNVTWYCTNSIGAWLKFNDKNLFSFNSLVKSLEGAVNIKNSIDSITFWLNKTKNKLYAVNANGKFRYVTTFDNELNAIADAGNSEYFLAFANMLCVADKNGHVIDTIGYGEKPLYVAKPDNQGGFSYEKADFPENHNKNLTIVHQYKPGKLFTASVSINFVEFFDDYVHEKFLIYDKINASFFDSFLHKYIFYNKENISIVDPETIQFTRLNSIQLGRVGLLGLSYIASHRSGYYILQAGDRVFLYDYHKNALSVVNTTFNLNGAKVQLYNDYLIMAGSFGLAYTEIKNSKPGKFTLYPNPKKLYYNKVNDFVVNSGFVQMSTDKGFYSFHFKDLISNYAANNTGGDYMDFVIKYPSIKKWQNDDTLRIDQVHQKIEVDALNYYGVGNIQYQYRIGAGADAWQTSSSGEIITSDLKPGQFYELYFIAQDDSWKSNVQKMYLYVIPYWWQTAKWKNIFWIAGVVVVILLVTFTVLFTRYIVARSGEKKQVLADMELRALYSQINPHFIFNTLGTALFFISKKRYDEAYNHVSRFSKLLRTYLTSSRKRYITLVDEIEMLKNYVELQQIRFEEKFDYQFEIDNKVPVDSIQIPTLLLQPLVENAINHGLFHKSSGGMLILKFLQGKDSNELICIIEDNGVGRQKAKEIKKESSIKYESYGMDLTRELIGIFKKYEDMNIYLEYIDKTGDESGTIVKLTIRNLKYIT